MGKYTDEMMAKAWARARRQPIPQFNNRKPDTCDGCGEPTNFKQAHADRHRKRLCVGCYDHIEKDSIPDNKGGRHWLEKKLPRKTRYDGRL